MKKAKEKKLKFAKMQNAAMDTDGFAKLLDRIRNERVRWKGG